jgi:formate dehydrogenase subunit gamma
MNLSAFLKHALTIGALVALLALPVAAQQPTSVNPTASSVKEKQLLDALKSGGPEILSGRVSIPDGRAGNLIQPAGKDFRAFHQDTLPKIGAFLILGMLGVLALFFMFRGRIRIDGGFSGRKILRFGSMSRFAHWVTATSFLLLGFTGLNLVFGKSLLLPAIGPEAFTNITQAGKFVHNYVSFAFALGIILMFVLWVKDNLPKVADLRWFAEGGGLIGSKHPPADRFNGGQKLIFWSTIVGGVALSVSGYLLMFKPLAVDIAGMQLATIVHGVVGLVLVAIIIAHIYIGSLGMEGAFDAMGKGEVDLNWAKEHHSLWVDKVALKNPKDISGGHAPAPAE